MPQATTDAAASASPIAPDAAAAPLDGKAPVKGVVPLPPRAQRIQRIAVLFITIVPMLGFVAAIAMLWGTGFTWVDATAFLFMYFFALLGVTVGFHRLLTHRSFDCPDWVATGLAAIGTLAIEGPVLTWVADHRRHHAFSDDHGDPHSPHLHEGEGIRGVLGGMWHAHVGWLFKKEQTDPARWCPDLLKKPGLVAVDRLFLPLVLVSYLLPALIGFALTGTLMGAFTAFLWGGLVRMLVLHHITWSINSICHFYGARPYQSDDESTNNWPLAIISAGESWHNNHHAFPSSAVHGLEWWQVDLTAMVIKGMEKVGLASNLRTPSEGARERRRRTS